MNLPAVEISPKAARRLRAGHVWVFRQEIRRRHGARTGDIVRVQTRHGSGGSNHLGVAFYNPASLIALRLITREQRVPDRAWWYEMLERALRWRQRRSSHGNAARLVHAEADGIPGLVVDRYDDVAVVQTLCAGTDRLRDLWVELLVELLAPRAVVERNDSSTRKLEGLAERTGVLAGHLDGPVEIREGSLRLLVDPLEGQKTGSYLDQSENRVRVASYGTGRCLDVFSYQGGFGLHLKQAGAAEVTLVDQSGRALQAAEANARLNGLEVKTRAANAFDFLKAQQVAGEQYDVVCLDPPAFAKNRDAIPRAARGYKEINLRAMRLLPPGGILITSSCSYHMQPEHFEEVLLDAARDTGRTVQIVERLSQGRDHPERLGFPESRYLKCMVLRVLCVPQS